ncbi:MAG: sulfite exporter TauE/SafE family protein [SAR324 cluster bacterium]|nr:sulfite exporter TauE/SafE family protein [SAR324 cluster bacterium]
MDTSIFIDISFPIILGLTSSLHCAGMCGGIVCSYTLPFQQSSAPGLWKYHTLYVAGRVLIYSWIGALMGALGGSVSWLIEPQTSLKAAGAWLGGGIMILGGAVVLVGKRWPDFISSWISQSMSWLVPSLKSWGQKMGPWKVFPLGMVSGILPCGMMWAVEMRAFATNSLWQGMLTMLVFCIATTPSLLLTAVILARVSPKLRYHSVHFSGILVLLMGIYVIVRYTGLFRHV